MRIVVSERGNRHEMRITYRVGPYRDKAEDEDDSGDGDVAVEEGVYAQSGEDCADS